MSANSVIPRKKRRLCAICREPREKTRCFPTGSKLKQQEQWVSRLGVSEAVAADFLATFRSLLAARKEVRWCDRHFNNIWDDLPMDKRLSHPANSIRKVMRHREVAGFKADLDLPMDTQIGDVPGMEGVIVKEEEIMETSPMVDVKKEIKDEPFDEYSDVKREEPSSIDNDIKEEPCEVKTEPIDGFPYDDPIVDRYCPSTGTSRPLNQTNPFFDESLSMVGMEETNRHFQPVHENTSRRRRGRVCIDEQLAISHSLPVSATRICDMPLPDLKELLKSDWLTETQRKLIRGIRRRGGNRLAARKCRERRGASHTQDMSE